LLGGLDAEVASVERLLRIEESSRSIGYLLKDRWATWPKLAEALRRVAVGEVVIDSHVIDRFVGTPTRRQPLRESHPHERRGLVMGGSPVVGPGEVGIDGSVAVVMHVI
jgi:hypothetical protein